MNTIIPVCGLWDDGVVLGKYKESCTYQGVDSDGNPQFESVYTQSGSLLHAMKYNGRKDTSAELANMCIEALGEWFTEKKIDVVLPAPATQMRDLQPVYAIAKSLADLLDIPYIEGVLQKIDGRPVKNIPKDLRDLNGSVIKQKDAKRICNILLVDDFFETGETANACVSVLKEDPLVDKVYYLAIAKTK